MKRALLACAAASAALAFAHGQTQAPAAADGAPVDFVRDVQPIFRQHCYACHGPTVHQAGLRLDRRADAMRGGTIAVIGPGTSEASRLYLRIAGKRDSRMPPTAALSDAQIDVIKRWIDEGAVWPDAASGDRAPVPTPPLMRAVLDDDAAAVKRLLDEGADPNAPNASGATALMWASSSDSMTRLLLDRGADPNAVSDDGRTALMLASGLQGNAPVVRRLLDAGANPAAQANGVGAIADAAYSGDEPIVRLLLAAGAPLEKGGGIMVALALQHGCRGCAEAIASNLTPKQLEPAIKVMLPPGADGRDLQFLTDHHVDRSAIEAARSASARREAPPPADPLAIAASPAASARAAVVRSLPLLQRNDVSFLKKSGCVSCHNNSLAAIAVAAARAHGFTVDEAIARSQTESIGRYIESWRERALVGLGIPGDHDSISYILLGLAAERYPRDESTDAMARFLMRMQDATGQWHIIAHRPPIESNDIEVTAASMRALQVYAPARAGASATAAVGRAAKWLSAASPTTTEERAFQLLGLYWSRASSGAIGAAARRLAAEQRADGGWSQLPTMTSDAYATGEALVALAESGAMRTNHAVYARGVKYLLSTQIADGSWFVQTRAAPIQPFFESGFPHGPSQFISAAATAWATNALALAAAPAAAERQRRGEGAGATKIRP